ncbi:hypothetical protein EYC80_004577 [Monilinia laxa]|uniref:Uncharacterized protein n=1 Tax=Monilinia laxa TaxID=61186 RepID=A0A5N6KH77_MONLA|nr:hypothetical protein EYC80_004577 [Monilinia laxa]
MTDLTFDNTPMECWVTLPAVWSEEAKFATLKAAKYAGFGKRAGDEIYTIAEAKENISMCDCGGSTIDITTYTIVQVQPYLTFDELFVGVGGKCGSTNIDRNLHLLLSKRFGSAFDDLPFSQTGPDSRFMAAFEIEIGPPNLDVPDSAHFDEAERLVLLTHKDMLSLFDPVINEIISLVEQQVKAAKDTQNAKIDASFLPTIKQN